MPDLTFRDFAGAMMQGNDARGAEVLQELLGLGSPAATAATAHFRAHMSDPSFMMKAMGLRTAVQGGSDDDIGALLGDCFGLTGATRTSAIASLRTRSLKS